MFRPTFLVSAACALTVAATLAVASPHTGGHGHITFAAGEPGDPKTPVVRTIEVMMQEGEDARMTFTPDRVEVRRGEQVKFVLRNVGKVDHEFRLDTVPNNAKHKATMEQSHDMEHEEANAKRLAPGAASEIVWRFTKPGTFEFACLIPGHYESGMHGTVAVK